MAEKEQDQDHDESLPYCVEMVQKNRWKVSCFGSIEARKKYIRFEFQEGWRVNKLWFDGENPSQ